MGKPLHVVLGASGGAGNAIARALHEAGHAVRGVNRSGSMDLPADMDRRAADVATPTGAATAVADADVVYLATQPPYHRWQQEFPSMLDTIIDAVPDGARLVMVDNLYAYGPGSSPMTEQTPERAEDRKGRVRRQLTQRLRQEHRAGRISVAIGRASDYFGPRSGASVVTALVFDPVPAGKTLRWMGSLDAPHSVAYLPDVARAYVVLGTHEQADGGVWILPHAPAVTGREFLALVNGALPAPRKTAALSATMLRLAAPVHRASKETLGVFYQWTEPFVVDDSAFQEAFGPFEPTPLEEAVRATLAATRTGGDADAP